MARKIGVFSLKGGVGKTSTVAALGAAIADFGKRVLLVDANLSAPNLGIHLNIIDPETTLHHALGNFNNIKDAIHKLEKFDVLPASLFYDKQINPMKLRSKLKSLDKDYDYILIDSSPALNDETLAAMLASDDIFVVTTPDFATLGTTLKAVKDAKSRGQKVSGLILNKVHDKDFELSMDDIQNTAGVPVLAKIPHDLEVLKATSNFVPSTEFSPKSRGSVEYKKLAATLLGEKYNSPRLLDKFRIMPSRTDINREIFYQRVME